MLVNFHETIPLQVTMRFTRNENGRFTHAQRLTNLHLTRTNTLRDTQNKKPSEVLTHHSLIFSFLATQVISFRVIGVDFNSEVSAFPRRLSNESKTRLTANDSVYFLAITDKIFPQKEKNINKKEIGTHLQILSVMGWFSPSNNQCISFCCLYIYIYIDMHTHIYRNIYMRNIYACIFSN